MGHNGKWMCLRGLRILLLWVGGMHVFSSVVAQFPSRRSEAVLDSIGRQLSLPKSAKSWISTAFTLRQVISEAEENRQKSDPLFVTGYRMLGQVYAEMDEPMLSIQNDLKAISLLSNVSVVTPNEWLQLLSMTGRVAHNYQRLGQHDRAISYALLAAVQSDTLQDSLPEIHASAHMVLADMYQGAGKYRQADSCYHEALTQRLSLLRQESGAVVSLPAQDLSATLVAIAHNLTLWGKADSAQFYLDKTLPVEPRLGKDVLTSIAQGRAEALAALHRQSEALAQYDLAIALVKSDSLHDDAHGLALLLEAQANTLIDMDRNETALHSLQKALILITPGFRDTLTKFNPKPALWTSDPLMFRLFIAKARAFKELGQVQFSLKCSQDAFLFIDHLRQKFLLSNAHQFESKAIYGLYEEAIDLAFSEYESTQWDTYKDVVFLLMERSKTNEILQSLHDAEEMGAIHLPDSLLLQLRWSQAQVLEAMQSGKGIESAQNAQMKLLAYLDENVRGFRVLTEPATLIQTVALGTIVDENEVFLEYFVGRQAVYIFAFDHYGNRCFKIPIDEDFQKSIQTVSGIISQAPDPGKIALQWMRFQKSSYLLYRALVEPVVASRFHAKAPKSIVVIPDGQLTMLPFECLLTRPGGRVHFLTAAYLVRDCNIRYGHSATLLAAQKRRPFMELKSMLALATNPKGLEPKLNLDDEAEDAAKVFDGKALYNKRAQATVFQRTAGDYRLLHLACQAGTDTSAPMCSYLALDNGSGGIDSLFAGEILGLRLNADLAAMGNSIGPDGQLQRGEDVMTMARAFMVAGCPRIVMSLWAQESRIMPPLMDKFYERLKSGKESDQSLRDARIDYLGSSKVMDEPRLAHPFYWAAMVAIGDDGPRLSQGPTNWTPWLIWGVILAIIIALVQRSRRRQKRKRI